MGRDKPLIGTILATGIDQRFRVGTFAVVIDGNVEIGNRAAGSAPNAGVRAALAFILGGSVVRFIAI